jgi:hypothetical protein
MGTANTYVFVKDSQVIAYYSLSAHQLQSDELPNQLAHGAPLAIPAYLIGKLAVTNDWRVSAYRCTFAIMPSI